VKSEDEQLALIRRGADQAVPEAELRQKLERSLKTNKPFRVIGVKKTRGCSTF
jgi:hypothetical protein